MKSIYTNLALYGSNNECARTDNILSPISEVCNGKVSLVPQKVKTMTGICLVMKLLCRLYDYILTIFYGLRFGIYAGVSRTVVCYLQGHPVKFSF